MKFKSLTLLSLGACLGFLSFLGPIKSAAAETAPSPFCESTSLKSIIDAIQCKRDNCTDDNLRNSGVFELACTQMDPNDAARFSSNVRIDTSADTLRAALVRVNDFYPALEELQSIRLDKPIKFTELKPCECLAEIEAKINCGIEQCQAAENPPVIKEPSQPTEEAPPPAKDQVPQAPLPVMASLNGGGNCSLNNRDVSASGSPWAILALMNVSLLGIWRRQRS